jgi:hypothetical protein
MKLFSLSQNGHSDTEIEKLIQLFETARLFDNFFEIMDT